MTGSISTMKNGGKYCLFLTKYQFKVFFLQHVSYTVSLNLLSLLFFLFLVYLL